MYLGLRGQFTQIKEYLQRSISSHLSSSRILRIIGPLINTSAENLTLAKHPAKISVMRCGDVGVPPTELRRHDQSCDFGGFFKER